MTAGFREQGRRVCEPCKPPAQEMSANRRKGNRETSLQMSVTLSKAPMLSCEPGRPHPGAVHTESLSQESSLTPWFRSISSDCVGPPLQGWSTLGPLSYYRIEPLPPSPWLSLGPSRPRWSETPASPRPPPHPGASQPRRRAGPPVGKGRGRGGGEGERGPSPPSPPSPASPPSPQSPGARFPGTVACLPAEPRGAWPLDPPALGSRPALPVPVRLCPHVWVPVLAAARGSRSRFVARCLRPGLYWLEQDRR